jgi:hypothetical protein
MAPAKARCKYAVKRITGGYAKFLAQMGDNSCHYISNNKTKLLWDSGSTDNICSKDFAERHGMVIDECKFRLKTYEQMNGSKVQAVTTAWRETRILGQDMVVEFGVLPEMGGDEAVLRYTWLKDWKIKQDLGTGDLEIGRNNPIGKVLSRLAKEMLDTSHVRKRKNVEGKTWQEVMPKE